MNYILFDDEARASLLPFTFTRPVAEIRIGILTIREKWEKYLDKKTSTLTEDYLSKKFPPKIELQNTFINASFLPTVNLLKSIENLGEDSALFKDEVLIAYKASEPMLSKQWEGFKKKYYKDSLLRIVNTWDIFSKNGIALQEDYDLLTKGRKSAPISGTNH